ncbi:MAG: putative LPS assembly protein LptD [Balneolaceae bacterium]|nr:putative LPS assembly protein LptD [Balneolaceae bacterium]
MLCLLQNQLHAQVIDTTTTGTDSVAVVPPAQNQGLGGANTAAGNQQTNLREGQVHFQASDSLIFNLKGDRKADLFGSAKVTHKSGELTSGKVSLNLDKKIVSATTVTPEDTLSQPVLVQDGNRIRSKSITFNYETERGRFEVARMQASQGNLTGTKVKNTGPHTVFLEDAIYSTCTLDHPHYYIKADRMKVVDQEEVFFTNARLYILDIPYPLLFPFGYIPGNIKQKQSGLLQPTYVTQGQANRSLGIQNLGWFQYFNDYIVGQASVDLYNSGTFFLDASSTYSNRNSYNGRIQIGYSRERGLVSSDPNFSVNTQKRLSINHNQEFSPYANISANINLRTQDFFQRNSFDIDERVETSTSSSISYRYRHPENTYNFSISARQNQNFQTNVTRLSGPSASFNLKQFSPFANNERGGRGNNAWYENIFDRISKQL